MRQLASLSRIRLAAALVATGPLAACALIYPDEGEPPKRAVAPVPAPPAPVAVPGPPPQPAEVFPLPLEGEAVIGEVQVLLAREEDTFPAIARAYGLGYDELRQANPEVDPWLPGEGTHIVLPTQFVLPDAPREGLVLNVATLRLFYYPPAAEDEPRVVITHAVGIGREEWPTPLGETHISDKLVDPTWYVPASIRQEHLEAGDPLPAVVPPGPDNPLGEYALLLGLPGYLIHGTNKPSGVGMRVSHGCVRLYPEDIETLFESVPVGAPVRLVDQPLLAGWRDGWLYLEVHPSLTPDVERDAKAAITAAVAARPESAQGIEAGAVDWDKVSRVERAARGIPVPVAPGSPSLETILAAAPPRQAVARAPDGTRKAESIETVPASGPPREAAAGQNITSAPESSERETLPAPDAPRPTPQP